MENRLRIEECLEYADQEGIYSIGSDVVNNPPTRDFVAGGVHYLRNKFIELQSSEHYEDKRAAKHINKNFTRNDFRLAGRALNGHLDEPIDRNITGWLSHGTDHDIEQFCLWNLHRTQQLTASINRDKPKIATHALEKTAKLERIGLFPHSATIAMERATDEYELKGMDAFFSGGHYAVGMCREGEIILSNTYSARSLMRFVSSGMKRYMFHEYMHGAGGDKGFIHGIKQPFQYLYILEESFVEHATSVAHAPLSPQHRIIDPRRRSSLGEMFVYTPERTFLAEVSEHARIAIEHIAEAYFTPRGDERGERLRGDIERKIGKFFGSKHEFFAFADAYQNAKQPEKDQLVYDTLSYLTNPPELLKPSMA